MADNLPDDAGEFIPTYIEKGIYEKDPFKTIDEDGVGWLLHLSAAKGRSVNPDLSLSVCGEHGRLGQILFHELQRHQSIVHSRKCRAGELNHVHFHPLPRQLVEQ